MEKRQGNHCDVYKTCCFGQPYIPGIQPDKININEMMCWVSNRS